MINQFNIILRQLFLTQVANLRPNPARPPGPGNTAHEAQIRFQPPNQEWEDYRAGIEGIALNIYMVDIRENRKLRSNERNRVIRDGLAFETPAPQRIDCHYLITAWDPAEPSTGDEPTLRELDLLYQVAAVLMNSQPLVPSRIGPLLAGTPAEFADAELPISILPTEGFSKLSEFWGTMGSPKPWKPAVYLIATLPVLEPEFVAGPPVTTRIAEYRRARGRGRGEVRAAIGGRVLDGFVTPPAPVAGAWVRLEKVDSTGASTPIATARSDALGQFRFERLPLGRYQLQWRARGYPDRVPRIVDIPSPTGEYDLIFE